MQLDKESRAGRKNIATSLLLSDAKLGIRNLINGIIVSAQDLPGELPCKCRAPFSCALTRASLPTLAQHIADMHLTYNDACPRDYNPPGFRACNESNFLINHKMTTRCDSLSTGHHGYALLNSVLNNCLTAVGFRSGYSVSVPKRTNQQ